MAYSGSPSCLLPFLKLFSNVFQRHAFLNESDQKVIEEIRSFLDNPLAGIVFCRDNGFALYRGPIAGTDPTRYWAG